MKYESGIVWLRRDLRLSDNTALYHAAANCKNVYVAFVVSPPLLSEQRMGAPLVTVFFDALSRLREDLRSSGGDLTVLCGDFARELLTLAERTGARALFFNDDYEPGAVRRDDEVAAAFERRGLRVHRWLDHVYFGAAEVARPDGAPYRMFTPYKRRWLDLRALAPRLPVPSEHTLRGKVIRESACALDTPLPETYGFCRFERVPPISETDAHRVLERF